MSKKNERANKWFELAIKDSESAFLLYKNGYYPQGLYFIHQSVEKLNKGIMVSVNWIKEPKQMSHDITFAPRKALRIIIDETIQKAKSKLTKSELDKLEEDTSKYKIFFSEEDLKKLYEISKGFSLMKHMEKRGTIVDLSETLEILDGDLKKLQETKDQIKLIISNLQHQINEEKTHIALIQGLTNLNNPRLKPREF